MYLLKNKGMRKIKGSIDTVIKYFLQSYVTFDQNRNDRSGALYKAWGMAVTNKIWGGTTSLVFIKEIHSEKATGRINCM